MTEDEYNKAVTYNQNQLTSGALTAEHVTSMTVQWQQKHGLTVDGKAGPNTIASIESVTQEVLNADAPESPPPPSSDLPDVVAFHDRRAYAAQVHGSDGQWAVTDR